MRRLLPLSLAVCLACGATDDERELLLRGDVYVSVLYTAPGADCSTREVLPRPAEYWLDYAVDPESGVSLQTGVCGDDMAWEAYGDDGSCWFFPQMCGGGLDVPLSDPFFTRDPGEPAIAPACADVPCELD